MKETNAQMALTIQNFSFCYPNETAILQNVEWQVESGAFHLLVGPTGSGKTTLLRSCKPAIAPTGRKEGNILVFDRPLDLLDEREAATQVGYVAQNPENQIVCELVWHELAFGLENVGMPQEQMRRRVAEVAHFFGIEPWFRRRVADLSGGQKQLLNLASILAMRPRILLLDEPTAQLDPVAEKNFLHALFRVNRELGLTVVIATHAPESMASYASAASWLEDTSINAMSLEVGTKIGTDFRSSTTPKSTEMDLAVNLHDIFFRYQRGEDWVLNGLDLAIANGSIHAIVGGNGSGKSTLLRIMAGVLKPERGRVSNKLITGQALMPQDPKALFVCDTVSEELHEWQKSCGYGEEEIEHMIERFNLAALLNRHPYDISGGQQQNLALAKLLLTDPSLLLLDEPVKGLDTASKLSAAHSLRSFASQGRTIVLVTHNLAFAACVADVVTMIFDGEATCTQPSNQFFEENLFYRPTSCEFTEIFLNSQTRARYEESAEDLDHHCNNSKPEEVCSVASNNEASF